MRVIEPPIMRQKHKNSRKKMNIVLICIVIFVLAAFAAWRFRKDVPTLSLGNILGNHADNDERIAAPETLPLRYLSGPDFQKLFEELSLAYPNTQQLSVLPEITGNVEADARIRTIAESRGYNLRTVPVLGIVKTKEPDVITDDLLQPRAHAAWQKLKARAKEAKIPIKLNSGYRSIEWQRNFFMERLTSAGIGIPQIISGQADQTLVSIMQTVAPPGYSRHHTGYAIDLICDDGTGRAFEYTACFRWLKQNNYQVAKEFGWIPSYPEDADKQGPEPEPWEYVWVGRAQLTQLPQSNQ